MNNIVLLRVGIDLGCGKYYSPIFQDNSFDFIPIPDDEYVAKETYGNTRGLKGTILAEYFPLNRKRLECDKQIHNDPEFNTFTYGDPTAPKRGLSKLNKGDLLVFYCSMRGFPPDKSELALYLIGYFEILICNYAKYIDPKVIEQDFINNFHVKYMLKQQINELLLIKGSVKSRLFNKAYKLSKISVPRPNGWSGQYISDDMEKIFGKFGGTGYIQRSTPRWVDDNKIKGAIDYILKLE